MRNVVALLCLAIPSATQAGTVCTFLASADPRLGTDDATCRDSVLLDGSAQTSCYWSYEYRAKAATARLEEIRREIEQCLGADAALQQDALVNHPDSFDLHQYEAQGRRVALSLKDKAGLGQSLIFLSISRTP